MDSTLTSIQIVLLAICVTLINAQNTIINGEVIRGLPCIKRLNQLYCHTGGQEYPQDGIESYIDDNKALLRRMYGPQVTEDPEPEPVSVPRTPASTTFVHRMVRNFGGVRFSRSVHEGFMEDLVEDDTEREDETSIDDEQIWAELLEQNYAELFHSFNVTGEEKEVMKELVAASMRAEQQELKKQRRPKRQAGFPGATRRENSNKIDVCESRVEVTTPYWATNSKGKVRAIVNNKQFEQAVHQEICGTSRTIRCQGDCACEQKYKWHRLLAYDPNQGDCGGIFMDWFLFPSCCACRCRRNPLLDRIIA